MLPDKDTSVDSIPEEIQEESDVIEEKGAETINVAGTFPYTATVGSYKVGFSIAIPQAQYNEYQSPVRLVISTSRNEIDAIAQTTEGDGVYKAAKVMQRLGREKNNEDGNVVYFYEYSGKGSEMLQPATTYYYKLVARHRYKSTGKGGKVTENVTLTGETQSFTTGAAFTGDTQASVGKTITVGEAGYSAIPITYTLSNPADEDIIYTGVRIESGNLASDSRGKQQTDGTYRTLVYPGTQTVSAHAFVDTRTGSGETLRTRESESDAVTGLTAKTLASSNVTVSDSYTVETSGEGTLTTTVTVAPFYAVDEGELYARLVVSGREEEEESTAEEYFYADGTIEKGVATLTFSFDESAPASLTYTLNIYAPYEMATEDAEEDTTEISLWASGNRTVKAGDTPTPVEDDTTVDHISLDRPTASVEKEKTLTLTPTAYTAKDNVVSDATFTWESSNETVATVENGLVTAVNTGTATITCTYTKEEVTKTATCAVTVYESEPEPEPTEETEVTATLFEESFPYTGSAIYPIVLVTDGEKPLTEKTDYTISYPKKSVNAGSYQVKVTFKGNYAKTAAKTLPYTIEKWDISDDEDFTANDIALTYTGKVQKVAPVLTWYGKTLKNGTDYTVSVSPATVRDAGDYTVTLTGQGNFEKTRTLKLTIADGESKIALSDKNVAVKLYAGDSTKATTSFAWNEDEIGERSDVRAVVTYKGTELPKSAYEFSQDSTEVGNTVLHVIGNGESVEVGEETLTFLGSKDIKIKITGTKLSSVAAVASGWVKNLDYSAEAASSEEGIVQPGSESTALTWKSGKSITGVTLSDKYTVSYTNNRKAGKATVTFIGINGFSGTIKKTFKIVSNGATNKLQITNTIGSVNYVKGGVTPAVTVVDNENNVLTQNVDYTVKYSGHKKVTNAAKVTVTGKGNYAKLKTEQTFTIQAGNLADATVTAPDIAYTAKSGKYMTKVTVTDVDGKKLTAGKDYEKLTKNSYDYTGTTAPAAGTTITVTIKGKGNYVGSSTTATYRVMDSTKLLSNATFVIKDKTYTGSPITLTESDFTTKSLGSAQLRLGGTNTPVDSSDYDFKIVGYEKNVSVGTAKVTLQGIGSYGGTKTVSFKIVAK